MKPAAKSASFPFLRQSEKTEKLPVGGVWKRSFDVVGAVLGLILLSPLFLMIALLVKFSDGGSVFYGHRRIGRDGNPFHCLKFRTMVEDGDAVLAAHFTANPEARAEWLATRKLQKDPRVTNVGTVLRKLSLDELPQLVNVLRGEMSLVGPRPVVKDEIDLYGPAAVYYFKSRPGLTGVWQISGRNDVSYDDRIAFDRYYVENWSFQKDIVIILKTIPAVCASRGSY
ncbi:exopolysaccharide biosynthesis protein [Paramesorhizobium deserti]|uniref:Exopolysaccharide biosynthesis protein n=1 Tax=Paramesorhizobium deserti TaxID=1494590 RepID=A0A135HTU2_9HYPH|nr:sugar transferase [Paramesorhizobium deserti]KXF76620.1 exopolysaccharide biosynthesis protein [Paramesorhizobium deserti]